MRHSGVVMETVVSVSCFSQAADPDVDYVIKVQIVICLLIKETVDLINIVHIWQNFTKHLDLYMYIILAALKNE